MICASLSAESGVSDAGLCTTQLPAASAGAILDTDRTSGKLNGVTAATTPSGSRRVNASSRPAVPGSGSAGRVDPSSFVGQPL